MADTIKAADALDGRHTRVLRDDELDLVGAGTLPTPTTNARFGIVDDSVIVRIPALPPL